MVAAVEFDEAQVTELVIFDVDPSLKFPVAVNCWEFPAATEELAGVTVIETIVAVTVGFADFPGQFTRSTSAGRSNKLANVRTHRALIEESHHLQGRARILT